MLEWILTGLIDPLSHGICGTYFLILCIPSVRLNISLNYSIFFVYSKGDGVSYPTRFDARGQSYNTMEEGHTR